MGKVDPSFLISQEICTFFQGRNFLGWIWSSMGSAALVSTARWAEILPQVINATNVLISKY